jgi:nitrogen fixation/metabolism regulation signal transduction histidine kinase
MAMKKRVYENLCDPESWRKELQAKQAEKARLQLFYRCMQIFSILLSLFILVIIGGATYANKQGNHQPTVEATK